MLIYKTQEHLLAMIPKTLHFIWGSNDIDSMPLSRLLAVFSFIHHNPRFRVKLHLIKCRNEHNSAFRGNEYTNQGHSIVSNSNLFARLSNLQEVEIIYYEASDLGFYSHVHPAHASDRLRYLLLSTEGGYYADTDIIFFNSIENAYFSSESVSYTHLTLPTILRV